MYKNLIGEGGRATREAILMAEERISASFSRDFVNFCSEYDGAKLNNAEIKAVSSKLGQIYYGVREFWPIEKIGTAKLESWDNDLVAFAEDSGGNFFVFHKSDMKTVYFLDHETNEKEVVTDNFNEFLTSIIEADYHDLPEAENAEVWVNPAFFKKQKDLGNAGQQFFHESVRSSVYE